MKTITNGLTLRRDQVEKIVKLKEAGKMEIYFAIKIPKQGWHFMDLKSVKSHMDIPYIRVMSLKFHQFVDFIRGVKL